MSPLSALAQLKKEVVSIMNDRERALKELAEIKRCARIQGVEEVGAAQAAEKLFFERNKLWKENQGLEKEIKELKLHIATLDNQINNLLSMNKIKKSQVCTEEGTFKRLRSSKNLEMACKRICNLISEMGDFPEDKEHMTCIYNIAFKALQEVKNTKGA